MIERLQVQLQVYNILPQERWENIFLQGQLSVYALISVSIPPLCYHSSTQKTLVILPKVQVAGCS